jgi:hypothetical protein
MRTPIQEIEDTHTGVSGHIYRSMRTHILEYEDTHIGVSGHMQRSMRTLYRHTRLLTLVA